jgi:hypothetical protein
MSADWLQMERRYGGLLGLSYRLKRLDRLLSIENFVECMRLIDGRGVLIFIKGTVFTAQ